MSTPKSMARGGDGDGPSTPSYLDSPYGAPPTYAAFSSSNLSTASASTAAKRRSTILVHQKSPLLLATPPQVTRALAYSHPFLLPLNKLVGLLSWTTGDPWESFLLLVLFWAVVQYGDVLLRWAGPIVAVLVIIGGMYSRRYSPLSSSGWADHSSWSTVGKGGKDRKTNKGGGSDSAGPGARETTTTRHQKTLDEIVETLKVFTTRCNILLEPLLQMTDFLSTQRTATSATTRPALTTLFVRILAVTPVWVALTLPPLRIITTKRTVLVFGTVALSWHSRVCRVSRALLWRSKVIRRMAKWITGLEFQEPIKLGAKKAAAVSKSVSDKEDGAKSPQATSALTAALKRGRSTYTGQNTGVRFTFILYENQRRWVGLGWTNSLFAYERAAWTDEHNNAVPPKDEFELPEVEDGNAQWRWVEGSKWRVDGASDVTDESEYDGEAGKMGWIYYDNKWNGGRRGVDGWGRWTRRRKWYRDAELVEVDEDAHTDLTPSPPPPELPARPKPSQPAETRSLPESSSPPSKVEEDGDSLSMLSSSSKSARFKSSNSSSSAPGRTPSIRRRTTGETRRTRRTSEGSTVNDSEGNLTPQLEMEIQGSRKEQDFWGTGDEVQMGLA